MSAPLILTADDQPVKDNSPYVLTPDAALIVMDDGNGCILDMDGEFYAISAIGAEMLRTTLSDGPEAAIAEIANRYQASRAQVQGDLEALMTDMVARGIVRQFGVAPKRSRGRIGADATAAIAGGLFAIFRGEKSRATIALTLARISFGLFGWTATVAAWKRRWPQPKSPNSLEGETPRIEQIDSQVRARAPRIWLDIDCKERAIACLALARLSRLPATLVIGVEFYPLGGHCWCEIGDRVVSDDPGNCTRYLPVFRYA